jgi:hypothetical protein
MRIADGGLRIERNSKAARNPKSAIRHTRFALSLQA